MKNKLLILFFSLLIFGHNVIGQVVPDYRKLHYLSKEEMTAPLNTSRDFTPTDPPSGDIRNVAEFDQMQGVLVRYPFGIPMDLIRDMADYTTVTTIVANSSQQQTVTTQYQNNNVNLDNCNFLIAPTDSYWVRDYGPWFVFDGDNNPGIVDFPYNRPRPNDNNIPQKVAQWLGIDLYGMNLISTGGNYMCDGMGQAASTDLVWDENPSLTHDDIAGYVEDYLNNSPYHVTADPLGEYIKHIDCWGKFLSPDKVLIGQVPTTDSRYQDFEDAANYFATQTSSYGKPYRVYRVFTPGTYPNTPYTNSLILNNKVFVPLTGSQWDDEALATYEEIMPGYEIIGITYNGWENTDALHCRTKGVADLGMLYINHVPTTGSVLYHPNYSISADITAYSGNNLYQDSLLIYYKINGGAYTTATMQYESGNTYTGVIENVMPSDTVSYYIYAADESGRNATAPYIGEPDPFVFTNIYFPTTEISFNPDTVKFLTPEQAANGVPLYIVNQISDNVTINSITEFGTNDNWYVEDLPDMPYTLLPDDSLMVMVYLNIVTKGEIVIDTLFVETNLNTYNEIVLFDTDLITDVDNSKISESVVTTYPNPTTGNINFVLQDVKYKDVNIQLYDNMGNKVYESTQQVSENLSGSFVIRINTDELGLSVGTYFYKISNGNNIVSGKLIKVQ